MLALDWITVPIKFTQVVTIAVYTFFFIALFGRQSLDITEGKPIPSYEKLVEIIITAPYYLALEFLFYVGWLKSAEVLINPFGDDDDDFEMNYIIDRNLAICNLYFGGDGQNLFDGKKYPYLKGQIPKEAPFATTAALPLCTPNVNTALENLTVVLDQHKEIVTEDITYFMKRASIKNASMRRPKALGFNNVMKSAVHPVLKGNNTVSDFQCFRSDDSKTNISIISSPKLEDRSPLFTIGNEKKLTSRKNVLIRKGTLI